MKAFLQSLEILSDLSDAEIDLLARTAKERRFLAKQDILRKGQPGDAAYILMEGAAEALIEKPGSEPLRLSKIFPGDMFGEMALLDDSPRSATVSATTDCTAVEISREAFLNEVAQNPHTALKLVALITRRLRRAEDVVSDFSDRIYGDVLPRLQDAVSAQLDSAKTICEETRARTEATITKAQHIQDTVDKHWTWWTRLGSLIGILALAIGGLAAVLGIKTFDDLVETMQADARQAIENISDAEERAAEQLGNLSDLEVLRQTVLQFNNMRRELQPEGESRVIKHGKITGDIARDFVYARRNLKDEYLLEAHYWDSQILIGALSLFIGAIDQGYMKATKEEWDLAIDSVIKVLHEPPEHWRQRSKLKELTFDLHNLMGKSGYREGRKLLRRRLEDEIQTTQLSSEGKSQTATILAALGSDTKEVKHELQQMLCADAGSWRRSQAAVDLISMGDNNMAWDTLVMDLVAQFAPNIRLKSRQENKYCQETERQVETTEEERQEDAFVAALKITEAANGPNIGHRRPERHMTVDHINQELSADYLSVVTSKPWSHEAGMDLVGSTVLEGLKQEPERWGRLYWQYACGLLCDLGCKVPAANDGGQWCVKCVRELESRGDNYAGEPEWLMRDLAKLANTPCKEKAPSSHDAPTASSKAVLAQ